MAFDELEAKINAGMDAYAIPGVAVAIWVDGQEFVKGYGVTNVDHPLPVDGDTVFRIGSTTKTFTGTAMMRLVEQGKVGLDSPVRRYIHDFAVADESVGATVTSVSCSITPGAGMAATARTLGVAMTRWRATSTR